MKEYIIIIIIIALLQIKKTITFPAETEKIEERMIHKKNKKWINKIITAFALLLITTAFTVGSPTYKALTPYHSTPVYKEKKLSYQPFIYEYYMENYSKNNFKIEDFKSFKNTLSAKYYQLQEHEQNIRRLGIIQKKQNV